MSVITPREPPAAAIGMPTGTMPRPAGRRHQRLASLGAGALLSVAVAFGAVLLLRPADAPPQAASSTVSVPALDLANVPTQALPDDHQAQADAVDRAQYLNDQVADHNNRLAQHGPLSPRLDDYWALAGAAGARADAPAVRTSSIAARAPLNVSLRAHDDWPLTATASQPSPDVAPRTHDDWRLRSDG